MSFVKFVLLKWDPPAADPVNEEALSDSRKMITNQQLELYNEAAVDVLQSSRADGRSRVKLLAASRQAAMETITQSDDGLHLPESTRNVVGRSFQTCSFAALGCGSSVNSRAPPSQGAMVLMNSACNKLLKPIDGSCCQTLLPPNLLQKLSACFFLGSALVFLVLHLLGSNHHRRLVPPDVESLEEKKPATAAAPLGPRALVQALCRMGVIMAYFYLCDRADVFMKEQKFYTHSTFFIPLIYIFVLGLFYSESSKEVRWSCFHLTWLKDGSARMFPPKQLCFSPSQAKLLNREQTDEWKGWMQLVILIYHISGASVVSPPCRSRPSGRDRFIVPVCFPVHSSVHARARAGGSVPVSDGLWTLLLFLAERRLQSVPSVPGDLPVQLQVHLDAPLMQFCSSHAVLLLSYLFFPLQVLFRLNFLVLVLCVVMDRPYQFYYFVPLVTFWFFIIYGTLAMWPQILQKKANGRCQG